MKNKLNFITFYTSDLFFLEYNELLSKKGLIRSKYKYGNNNILLYYMNKYNPFQKIYNNNLFKYQKVYMFPNASFYFRKDILYRNYYEMKKLFFIDFDYIPETYCYPKEKYLIEKKFNDYKLNISDLWILKPSNWYGGNGISFLITIKNITMKEFVLSKYIQNLSLINGKKYDLRLYVLISGLKPLRIYLYKEGLVRIASEIFSINTNSIKNKFIHLTNTDVNKLNKNYIRPNNSYNQKANIWNIFMYKKFLKENNIDWNTIKEKIKDIIIKSMISVYYNLTLEIEKNNLNDQNYFEILGFDILITNDFVPKLIEINFAPELAVHNDLDKPIKYNLFIEALDLIGIVPFSRNINESLNYRLKLNSDIDEKVNNALCELERPKGRYELIFPIKENIDIYTKYFLNNSKENIKFWNNIKSPV